MTGKQGKVALSSLVGQELLVLEPFFGILRESSGRALKK